MNIDVHPLSVLARRWSKHCNLSDKDRSAILGLPFTRGRFGKEAYLVREGDHARDCSLLLKGFAFRQKLLRDGRRQIISIHIPSEFIDLESGLLGAADHNVQSVDGCETASIARAALIEPADSRPAIRLAMWIDTLIDASIVRECVVNVGRRDSRTRIAHLLCELALRLTDIGADHSGMFDFPLTQEQLPTVPASLQSTSTGPCSRFARTA